uniref:Uncharacterized protein n=1 Tax=Tetradesmus obliquus TaxID=3088 RepID=A0A383WGY3_TETOB|eukprot:jgi/Sobl393_1/1941/SZX76374.1
MRALVAEAAVVAKRVLLRYAALLLVYFAYALVLQPIARRPSAPAAAVFGDSVCSSGSSSSAGAGAVAGQTGGLLFAALLWLAGLPMRMLGSLKAGLCRELLAACNEGLWFPGDCTVLFQQPGAAAM